MPQLLLELFQEEIPARMQKQASEDLRRLMLKALAERGLGTHEAIVHVTPRRLTLVIEDLPAASEAVSEELKGPRTSAPPAALDGFLKKTGLTKDQLTVQADPKGDFYVARIEKDGRPAPALIAEAVIETVRAFPWPKSMKWEASGLQWVRPLRSILCLFDGQVVPFEIAGLTSGNVTRGHRQMANEPFEVSDFADYEMKLRERRVVLDRAERMQIIDEQCERAAADAGLSFHDDDELLEEVAGLVEFPVVLTGAFDPAFLEVPQEVLIGTMRKNQKYFALTDANGKLAEKFLIVSNLEARDGGKAIIAGNERVLRARLSDAKFFWDNDKAITLAERLPKLDHIVFHAKLGTLAERVHWLETIARQLALEIGADEIATAQAARLAKADLVSGTVGEFPEVQGLIGGYLARSENLGDKVATAIADQYRPAGPSDTTPTALESIALGLAERLSIVRWFFQNGEKPTGSKDPFALRRAALGAVRLLLENEVRLDIRKALSLPGMRGTVAIRADGEDAIVTDVVEFIADRLKVALRDRGVRHDLIDATFKVDGIFDIVLLVRRVEALQAFLATEDGKNLLAGTKRAANILRIEEKKDGTTYAAAVDAARLTAPEEKALAAAIDAAMPRIESAIAAEDFAAAMSALAALRAPVDSFFERVKVNDDDKSVRANRLNLLARIKQAAGLVADFAKIEG